MVVRSYPSHPIPGVGAIIIGKKGILLARRDKAPSEGLWSIPGGVIEVGETQQEAILREVEEETGIKVEILEMIGNFDLIVKDSLNRVKYHYVLTHFLARALSDKIRPEFPNGEVHWFPITELPENEIPTQLLDFIIKNKQKLLDVQSYIKRQEV